MQRDEEWLWELLFTEVAAELQLEEQSEVSVEPEKNQQRLEGGDGATTKHSPFTSGLHC